MTRQLQLLMGATLLLLSLVSFPQALMITLVLPKQYSSSLFIIPSSSPDTVIPKEAAILKTEAILKPVVTNLGLNIVFAKREHQDDITNGVSVEVAVLLLKPRVHVREDPLTRMLKVTAESEDPVEAAAIANEIGRVYCDVSKDWARPGFPPPRVLEPAKPSLKPSKPTFTPWLALCGVTTPLGLWLLWLSSRPRRPTPPALPAQKP